MRTFPTRWLTATATLALLVGMPNVIGSRMISIEAAGKYDWLQFDGDPQKTGIDAAETTLTSANVGHLAQLFHVQLGDATDGAPVELAGVTTPSGVRDLLYIEGEHGHLYAVDASTGATIWTKFYGGTGYTNSAPAIDPNRQFVYVAGLDGLLHKLQVGDGTEITTGGFPVRVESTGKIGGQLAIATAANGHTYLYAGGQGKGHISVIDLASGATHVFNTICSNMPDVLLNAPGQPTCALSNANPWSRPTTVYVPGLDRVFTTTGTYSQFSAGTDWDNSLLALAPDGTTRVTGGGGYPLDSYTPTNWSSMVAGDHDLGSTDIVLLPHIAGSKYQYLGVLGSKDNNLRVLNLADLSGKGGPGNLGGEVEMFQSPLVNTPGVASQGAMLRSQGVAWTNPADGSVWLLQPGDNGVAGLQITADSSGNLVFTTRWVIAEPYVTSVIVADNVLYAASGGSYYTTRTPHNIRAIDPVHGTTLWQTTIGELHWETPIVANGVLYMPDGNSGGFGTGTTASLWAWSVPGASPAPPSPTPTVAPCTTPSGSPTAVTATAGGGGAATVTWTPPSDTCAPVTAYVVYIYPASGVGAQEQETLGASYAATGLTPSTYYTFTVTAWNGNGWSGWSAWAAWVLVT